MAVLTRTHITIIGFDGTFPFEQFGPWPFDMVAPYTEFVGTKIQIPAQTLVQLVGGTNPQLGALHTVLYLALNPDQALQVGLHGVNAQSAGWTLNANGLYTSAGVSINAVQVYNTALVVANVFVVIGGQ